MQQMPLLYARHNLQLTVSAVNLIQKSAIQFQTADEVRKKTLQFLSILCVHLRALVYRNWFTAKQNIIKRSFNGVFGCCTIRRNCVAHRMMQGASIECIKSAQQSKRVNGLWAGVINACSPCPTRNAQCAREEVHLMWCTLQVRDIIKFITDCAHKL